MRLLCVEMQGVAALEDDPLVHEVDLDLALMDEDELFAEVLLERRVTEIARGWTMNGNSARAPICCAREA